MKDRKQARDSRVQNAREKPRTAAKQPSAKRAPRSIDTKRAALAKKSRKAAERRQDLAVQVLELLNEPSDPAEIFSYILQRIKDFTGAEAAAIRLREGEDFPFYETIGFSIRFVTRENHLIARDAKGAILRDGNGCPVLECFCGQVITGRVAKAFLSSTKGGSFWTGGSNALAARIDDRFRLRNRCGEAGYESLALIPLRSGSAVIGLLQLCDKRKRFFRKDMVVFFEHLGASIGVALARKQAGESLQRSERKYRDLVETLQEGIWAVDQDGCTLFVNSRMAAILGYAVDEMLGKHLHDFVIDGDREACAKFMGRRCEGVAERREFVLVRKDRTHVIAELTAAPVYDEEKEYTGALAGVMDITSRKKTEADKAAIEQQLLHSQKMEAIGTLAGGVAHDFNNMLTGVLGHAYMLQKKAEPGSDVFRSSEVIVAAALRAAELTKQLLGFARKTKMRNISVDVHRVINDVVSFLKHAINKNVELVTEFEARNLFVMGDPGQILQVVMNLAVNAGDAMPEGGRLAFGTKVEDVTANLQLGVESVPPGTYLVISVTDTGTGIETEIIERIFDPFYTTKKKGSGMGLATAYGIARSHGGWIKVESSPGKGSTFNVYLPLTDEKPLPEEEVFNEKDVAGEGLVLVVDDEPIVRDAIQRLLVAWGYDVAVASNGQDAIDIYKSGKGRVDLVILDLIMPVMNGWGCFMALKAIDPDVKVIMMSGFGLQDVAEKLGDEGVLGFIEKPFTIDRLATAVATGMTGEKLRPRRDSPAPPVRLS